MAGAYQVCASDRPIQFEAAAVGPRRDDRYSLAEARAEAARLIAAGLRGVAIWDESACAVREWWPSCKAILDRDGNPATPEPALSAPVPKFWLLTYCGRHDLCDDGLCTEHTQVSTPARLAVGEQLAIGMDGGDRG